MEVNLSPSLATDAPLDAFIKSNLVSEALTLVGMKKPESKRNENFGLRYLNAKKSSKQSSKNTSRLSSNKNEPNAAAPTNKDNKGANSTVTSLNNPFKSKASQATKVAVDDTSENVFFAKNKALFDKINVTISTFSMIKFRI